MQCAYGVHPYIQPTAQVVHMLILTRRIGETIKIGDEVSITILDAKGGGTKIGINAPKEISVHREEIYDKIARESKNATPANNSD